MTIHAPVPDYAAARRAMVDSQLRPQGVIDLAVLEAMNSVPRENFLPTDVRPLAYVDRSLPLGGGRFLAAPAVLGQLLNQLMPVAGERALVVGAGTGYSSAVLAKMGLEVTALESSAELVAQANSDGFQIVQGALEAGYQANAPYHVILLDGAVEHIPQVIVEQLADGGRLGGALVERGVTRLIVGRKAGDAFGYLSIGDAGVAALPGFTRPRTFTF